MTTMSKAEQIKRFRLQLDGLQSWPDDEARASMQSWCLRKIEALMRKPIRKETLRKAYRMAAKFDARRAMEAQFPFKPVEPRNYPGLRPMELEPKYPSGVRVLGVTAANRPNPITNSYGRGKGCSNLKVGRKNAK